MNQNTSSRTPNAIHPSSDSPRLPLRSNVGQPGGFRAVNSIAAIDERSPSYTSSNNNLYARSGRNPSSSYQPTSSSRSDEHLSHIGETIEVQSSPPKSITFKDGEPPQGRASALLSITTLIHNNLRIFREDKIGGRPWSKSDKKPEVYIDDHRKVIYLSDNSSNGQELHVSRYIYGSDKQILVAWVPDPDLPGSYIAHIFAECGQGKHYNIERNGVAYSSKVRWFTWVPSGRHIVRTIYKFVKEVREIRVDIPRPSGTRRTASEHNYHQTRESDVFNSCTTEIFDTIQSDDTQPIQNHEHAAKRIRLSDIGTGNHSRAEHHTRSDTLDSDAPLLRRATTSAGAGNSIHPTPIHENVQQTTVNSRQDPSLNTSQVFSKVSVLFIDFAGNGRGPYPGDECNTAQKLFDLACVCKAAFAKTSPGHQKTRTLRISFNDDDDTWEVIRVDNESDFQNLVSSMLREKDRNEERIITVTAEN